MRRHTTLALVAGGAAAAAAGGAIVVGRLRRYRPEHDASNKEGRTMEAENWYLEHKPKIMRQVRSFLRPFRKPLAAAYGKEEGEAIVKDAIQRFEALLPDIPYIGGGENPFTKVLCKVATKLAMYQALRARGASVEEAARLIHLGEVSFLETVPTRWRMRLQGRLFLTQKGMNVWRHVAATSQERRYPEDWVYEVVEGDGQGFAFGVDCTECAAVKYLDREGAPELAQYLCWSDYPQFAAMHLRLDRTETLAQGGQRCDFRMSRGRPVQVEPEFLHG
jgi:hypothetical protein